MEQTKKRQRKLKLQAFDRDLAATYGTEIIQVIIKGVVLDLSQPGHFEIYKTISQREGIEYEIKSRGFAALRDNQIVAVYKPKNITIL